MVVSIFLENLLYSKVSVEENLRQWYHDNEPLQETQERHNIDFTSINFNKQPEKTKLPRNKRTEGLMGIRKKDQFWNMSKAGLMVSQAWQDKLPYGPHREKSCLRGFRQSDTQTSPLSYGD